MGWIADGGNFLVVAVPVLVPVFRRQKLLVVATKKYKQVELSAVGLPILRVLMLGDRLIGILYLEADGINRSICA